MLGQTLRILVNETKDTGVHNVVWDGRDARGLELTSGVYLYRLEAGTQVAIEKMILAK
jgi:flagellar hook assembly protein FlgD